MSDGLSQSLCRLIDGSLPAGEGRQLVDQLLHSREVRLLYCQQSRIHALLQWRHGKVVPRTLGDIDPIVIAELICEAEAAAEQEARNAARLRAKEVAAAASRKREMERLQSRRVSRPQPIEIPYIVLYAGIAALAACVAWVVGTLVTVEEPTGRSGVPVATIVDPSIERIPAVATIVDQLDAKLSCTTCELDLPSDGSGALAIGTSIVPGTYALEGGVIELGFDNGVHLMIEAPSKLEILSSNRARLESGRVVGFVPPLAVGYTVETPTTSVVDLGTEFGVTVDSTRESDVHVFDGVVEVVAQATANEGSAGPDGRIRQRLTVDQGVRVQTGGTLADATTAENLYFRDMPTRDQLLEKQAYERWLANARKLSSDPDVVAHYTFDGQLADDTLLKNQSAQGAALDGGIRGATWGVGRWSYKQSLRFAGDDPNSTPERFVAVNVPGEFDALTLAAWVKVDALAICRKPGEFEAFSSLLMSDDWSRTGQLHWQLSSVGCEQVGIGGVPGADNLKPDTQSFSRSLDGWRFIVFVYDGSEGLVSMYHNGSPTGAHQIDQATKLTLGSARIGGWAPEPTLTGEASEEFRTLHGCMDELLIVRRALTAEEIQSLYVAGAP